MEIQEYISRRYFLIKLIIWPNKAFSHFPKRTQPSQPSLFVLNNLIPSSFPLSVAKYMKQFRMSKSSNCVECSFLHPFFAGAFSAHPKNKKGHSRISKEKLTKILGIFFYLRHFCTKQRNVCLFCICNKFLIMF